MKPENGGPLEEEILFGKSSFTGSMLVFGGEGVSLNLASRNHEVTVSFIFSLYLYHSTVKP